MVVEENTVEQPPQDTAADSVDAFLEPGSTDGSSGDIAGSFDEGSPGEKADDEGSPGEKVDDDDGSCGDEKADTDGSYGENADDEGSPGGKADDKGSPGEKIDDDEGSYGDEKADEEGSYGSHAEIPLSTHYSSFKEEQKLGKGGYGSVYLCRSKFDDALYAVKRIKCTEDNQFKHLREAKMMATLYHPYIVRYHQSWIEDGVPESEDSDNSDHTKSSTDYTRTLYIAMEYCPKTLEKVLKSELTREVAWTYVVQLAKALYFIHIRGIIHRDISRQNIFIGADDNIRIADFGLGIYFDMATSTPILTSESAGNIVYRAPELNTSPNKITPKADMYSLGLLAFEILNPMKTDIERAREFDRIKSGNFDWSNIGGRGATFLPLLLEKDPSKRISVEVLVEWIEKLC